MLQAFLTLAGQALREPREAATTLLAMGVPRAALWPAFGALVALSVVVSHLGGIAPAAYPVGQMIPPFAMAFLSAVAGAASVAAVWKIGQAMGGKGSFDETLLLTVFLQAILLAGQLVELVLILGVPPLADIYYVALIVLGFWLNINFIAALHGFASLWKSFGVLMLSSLAVAATIIVAMMIAGIQIAGAV